MQEDINNKTLALSIKLSEKGARLTADVLKAAMKKYLDHHEKAKASKPNHKVGKQSVRSLMKQNKELANLEITNDNIGSFNKVARKYGIDYSLRKDMSSEMPHYIVFFKARDVNVMTQAFKEYSSFVLNKDKKPSLREKLNKFMEKSKVLGKNREKVRERSRGLDL